MKMKPISYMALAVALATLAACTVAPAPGSTATPLSTSTAHTTGTPPGIPVTGATATAAPPLVSVTSPTNCRTGPSTAYGLVFVVNPGAQYTILGTFTGGNYWIIQNPLGGSCWLWGQNAVVTGNTASLPAFPAPSLVASEPSNEVEPTSPPVIVATLPGNLSNLSASRTCQAGVRGTTPIWIETVTLTWSASSNQNGYNVFKGDSQIATLASTATSFITEVRYLQTVGSPQVDTYRVEAFNSSGTSSRQSVNVVRCP